MKFALALALVIGSASLHADMAPPRGLCDTSETTYFACQTTKQRWIALCGELPATLQYRFGRANSVEFRFPAQASAGPAKMLFAHYSRYQTERAEVAFNNVGVDYAIFDYLENGEHRVGVRVTTTDGKERELLCAGKIISRLGELKGVLGCDPDNALNGGICP